MGLSVYSKNCIDYPILTCDSCRETIKDIRLAIITFPDLLGHITSHSSGIYHKGRCDHGSKTYPYSEELACYLQQLAWNLKLGKREAKGSKRTLVIEMPEYDGIANCIGRPLW